MISNEDGNIVVTGDSVKPIAELMRLHGWRQAANMKLKFGMSSKHYPSVKAFRAEYGSTARSWAEVQRITDEVIKEIRAELEGN
jgi:hypothetical protein